MVRICVCLLCFVGWMGFSVGAEPMELAELVDRALRCHPKTREAWAFASAAGSQWKMAQSACYPEADFMGEACVAKREYHGQDSTSDEELRYRLAAQYLLLDFGGRQASIDSARLGFYSVSWQRDRTLQDVILGVLQAYYHAIDAKATFEAKREDLKDAETNFKAAEALFEMGLTSKIDVLQSQSEFLNQQLQLEEKRGILHVSLGQLANAVGMPANTEFQVAAPKENIPLEKISKDMEELLMITQRNRPDLAAARARYAQKKADLAVACSDGKPTLSANAEMARNNYLHNPSHNSHHYSGCLTLQVPLFHGFFYRNQRRKAEAEVASARAAFEDLELDAGLQVVQSYYAFKTAVETFRYSEELLKTASKSYEASLAGYKEGISSILDVLAAQVALSKARTESIQSRTLWQLSLANLAFATGTLGGHG